MVNVTFTPNGNVPNNAANTVKILSPNVVKQGDTENDFRVQLLRGDAPVDLTGATVTWSAAANKGKFVQDRAATVESEGIVGIAFTGDDQGATGSLRVEFKVTYADGDVEKFPAQNYAYFEITRSLDDLAHTPVMYASVQYFESQVAAAQTAAESAETAAQSAENRALLVEEQGAVAEAQGLFAQEKGTEAATQAEAARAVAVENKTRFLNAVSTVALRDSTYPNPAHGDTVRVTGEAVTYRFVTGSGWVKTDQYNPTAIDEVNRQLAETAAEISERVYTKSTTSIKPLVSFYLDDGYQQDYTVVYPKAKTLGVPLTVCLHNDSWFTVNPNKLNEVVADGWEVHAHTVLDQDLRALTYEQQFQTMKQNKDLLESLGHKVEGLCYPRGFSNADTLKATRALFKVGMSSVQSVNAVPIDTYYIKRILTDSYDMAEMKAMVDSAIATGKGWLIFYSHSNIYETNTTVRDRYFEIMDYVATANIETVTVRKALETYANTLDIGDVAYSKDFMKIGADGSIDSTILPVIYGAGNTTANTKAGTAYKSGRITVDKFMATSPSDIPIDNGVGILHTDRLFEDYKYVGSRALQRFDGINGTTALRTFNGSWSDWTVTGNFNTRKTKAYTAASPITDYPAGKVTKVTFISGEAADLPEGGIGTLETTRLSANDVLNYQIFHPYNKTIFYKRVWINGAWSTFRRFSSVIFHAATHDFGVVNAGSTVSPTFTINDIVIGDVVSVNFEYGVANGVIPFAYISAANTVTVKLTNVTAANVTVGSRPLKFVVNKA